jgi:hypothetical protein
MKKLNNGIGRSSDFRHGNVTFSISYEINGIFMNYISDTAGYSGDDRFGFAPNSLFSV